MLGLKNKIKSGVRFILKKYHVAIYGSCVVLLYHRITDIETDPQLLCVKPYNFNEQLKLLSKNYKVLSVEEFSYHLKNKKRFPENSILITFDDGYADNFLEALPLLEKHKMQALFYIATGTLNTTNEYWWDAVERIALLSAVQPTIDSIKIGNIKLSVENLNETSRKELYNLLLKTLRGINSKEREKTIDELAILFESTQPRNTHRAMTSEELKKMNISDSAVLGAHTHLHPSLATLTYNEQFEEISQSKNKLEELIGEKTIHFSYPFGTGHDFNEDSISIVKKLKFELVAANYKGVVNTESDVYRFPRFLVRDWDMVTFEKQLNSFFNYTHQ